MGVIVVVHAFLLGPVPTGLVGQGKVRFSVAIDSVSMHPFNVNVIYENLNMSSLLVLCRDCGVIFYCSLICLRMWMETFYSV